MHTRGQHISCINVREKAYLKMSPPINKQLPPSFPAELWYLLGTAVLLSTLRQLEAENETYLGMLTTVGTVPLVLFQTFRHCSHFQGKKNPLRALAVSFSSISFHEKTC